MRLQFVPLPDTSLEEALTFLNNARKHLGPGGLLGVEVSAFSPEELAEEPDGPELHHDFTPRFAGRKIGAFQPLPDTMRPLKLWRCVCSTSYTMKMTRCRVCREHDLEIRVTNRDELILMLRLAGFEVEAVYGGFVGEPFTSESDHLIILARKV